MLTRRGFTLIEMMVAIVMLAIVGMATTRILRTMMNTSAAQVQVGANQGNMRSASLAIPLEFREIGYDTVPGGGSTSDLIAIKANRLTFRAMRGMGTTCGTPTLTEYRIRKPTIGQREPRMTDGFLLFLDNDYNQSADDQWVPMEVSSIVDGTCGSDSAYVITLSATPVVDGTGPGGLTMAIANIQVGGPIRWYETMEYGPYIDGTTGEVSIGARSISAGETSLLPMIGPIPDSTGFTLTYYNKAGAVLNPASAVPTDVRSIGISITGVAVDPSSLAGTTKRARSQTTVTTVVALRNTLRP